MPTGKSRRKSADAGAENAAGLPGSARDPAEALEASEVRYRRLFETAKDGIFLLDAATGRITDVNPFLEDLLGYSHDELIGKALWEIGPVKDIQASQEAMRHLQAQEYIRYENLPLETRWKQRVQVEFVSNVYLVDGERVIQCNVRDITARWLAENKAQKLNDRLRALVAEMKERGHELREQATRDALTGLYNRRYLDETLARELHRALRRRSPLCVALLDLDHFKQLNDTFGHEAGDGLLRELAGVLRDGVRRSDVACRYGGDEFVLVLPDASLVDTRQRVEQIRALVRDRGFLHGGVSLGRVTLSAGVAQAHADGCTPGELLHVADEALYAAKQAGRDRVVGQGLRE